MKLHILALSAMTVLLSMARSEMADLRRITMPHEFTASERQEMNVQIDKLRLGIDLFLAQQGVLDEEQQQKAFCNVWPLVALLFKSDFDQ